MKQFIYDTTCVRGATFNRAFQYSSDLTMSSSAVPIALGTAIFATESDLSGAVGKRVRAFVLNDPTQFVEGEVEAFFPGVSIAVSVDKIGGEVGTTYSSWQITQFLDLTGATFLATMVLNPPDSCAGRERSPITLTVPILDADNGVFAIYLSPGSTANLTLGKYSYKVLYTPAASSDKFLVVRGTIIVTD